MCAVIISDEDARHISRFFVVSRPFVAYRSRLIKIFPPKILQISIIIKAFRLEICVENLCPWKRLGTCYDISTYS